MSGSVGPHRQQPTRLPHPRDSPGKNTGVGWHFLLQCRKVKSESEVAESCPTLSDPMDCGPPGSSVHGIFQARVLEWGAIAFSKSAGKTYNWTSIMAHTVWSDIDTQIGTRFLSFHKLKVQVLYNYGRQTELIYGGIEYPSEKHHGQCIKIKNRVTPGEGGNPPGACEKKKKE